MTSSKNIIFFRDKKRIAWLVWGMLKNNKFKTLTYSVVTCLEYLVLYFYMVIIILQFEDENDNIEQSKGPQEESVDGLVHIIHRSNILKLFQKFTNNLDLLNIFQYVILAYLLTILIGMFCLLGIYDKPAKSAEPNVLAQILTFMFQIQNRLFLPIEVWIVVSSFLANDPESKVQQPLIYSLNIFILLEIFIVDVIFGRLFNIRIKNEMIPWGQQNSIHYYYNMVLRMFIPLSNLIPGFKTQIVLTTLFTTSCFCLTAYLQPFYDPLFRKIRTYLSCVLFIQNLTFLLFIQLGIFGFAIETTVIFAILSYPMMEVFIILRKKELIHKYHHNELKTVPEIEGFIIMLIEYLGKYQSDKSSQIVLLSLVWGHKKQCQKTIGCICNKMFQQVVDNEEQPLFNEQNIDFNQYQEENQNEISNNAFEHSQAHILRNVHNNDDQLEQKSLEIFSQNLIKDNNDNGHTLEEFNYLFKTMSKNQALKMGNNAKRKADSPECPIQDFQSIIDEKGIGSYINQQETLKIILLLIYDFIKEQDAKFSFKDQRLISIKAYYELVHLKNKFLCHSTITRLGQLNFGFVNLIMMLIDSQYLLDFAEQNTVNKEKSKIDFQLTIDQNSALQEYYELNDKISTIVSQFWGRLSSKNQDIEVIYKEGIQSSRLIKKAIQKFEEIQEINSRNYHIFYQYACFQKYILNNDATCNLYIKKMEQIREIKRAIKNKYKDEQIITDSDEAGFIIVKATFKEFGQILFINKSASQLLGYENNELISKSINVMMPGIIAENHHKFWKKFNEYGIPKFIENEQHLFMKNSEGYIFPVLAFVKFNHDKRFGHSFIAIVNKVKYLVPFQNQRKYTPEEVMVLMTDEKDHLIEINQSVNDIVGINSEFIEQNSKYISDALKINQIFDIDEKTLCHQNNFESNCCLNISFSHNLLGKEKPRNLEQFIQSGDFNNAHYNQNHSLTLKMITQNYKDGILHVKYFVIGLSEHTLDNPLTGNLSSLSKTIQDETKIKELVDYDDFKEGNSQDSNFNLSEQQEVKDIVQLIEGEKTPKMLRMILQLVSLCFIIMITISSTNMGQFLSVIKKANADLLITSKVLDRMLLTSQSSDLMRLFLSLQQYQPSQVNYKKVNNLMGIQNQSQLSQILQSHIITKIDLIKEIQIQIDQNFEDFSDKDYINSMQKQNTIEIETITKSGQNKIQNQTMTTAINIYVQQAQFMVTYPYSNLYQNRSLIFDNLQNQFLKVLNMTNQNPKLLPSNVLLLEQEIYSFFQLGYHEFTHINSELSEAYKQETLRQFDSKKNLFIVMMIISISSIFVIIVAVIPNFSRIQNRRYQVLGFFFLLNPEIVQICFERSNVFEVQFYDKFEDDEDEIMRSDNIQHFREQVKRQLTFKIRKIEITSLKDLQSKLNYAMKQSPIIEQLNITKDQYSQGSPGLEESKEDILIEMQATTDKQHEAIANKISLLDAHKKGGFYGAQSMLNFPKSLTFKNQPKPKPAYSNLQSMKESAHEIQITIEKEKDRKVHFIDDDVAKERKQMQNDILRNNYIGIQKQRTQNQQTASNLIVQPKHQNLQLNPDSIETINARIKKLQDGIQNNNLSNISSRLEHPDQNQQNFDLDLSREKNENNNNHNTSKSNSFSDQLDNQMPQTRARGSSFHNRRKSRVTDIRETSFKTKRHIIFAEQQEYSESEKELNDPIDQTKKETEQISPKQENQDFQKLDSSDILLRIKQISQNGRIKVAISLLIFGFLFSSYFVGISLHSNQTLTDIHDAVYDQDILYQRQNCLIQMFVTYREQLLYNYGPSNMTSKKQINTCIEIESRYTELKRRQGVYFYEIHSLIDDLDTEKLCSIIIDNFDNPDFTFTLERCHKLYNSVLRNGLSSTYQIILKHFLMETLDLESYPLKSRTPSYLLSKFEEQDLLLFIYMTEFIIDPAYRNLLSSSFKSIFAYQEEASKIQVIVFSMMCLILVIALIVFVFVVFKRMKRLMIDCNTLLKIMPIQYLEQEVQENIKKFIIN